MRIVMKKLLLWCCLTFSLFSGEVLLNRSFDAEKGIFQDEFLNGQQVRVSYENGLLAKINIGDFGSAVYEYFEGALMYIHRVSPDGEVLYTHTYNDLSGKRVSEDMIGDLGSISYNISNDLDSMTIESPYGTDSYPLRTAGEPPATSIARVVCDENGNLCHTKGLEGQYDLTFNAQNQLIHAVNDQIEIDFIYDDVGRRVAKTTRRNGQEKTLYFLYFGRHEIASYDETGELKALRILGPSYNQHVPKAVAFEAGGDTYAPIHDSSLNVKKLINIRTKRVLIFSTSPFGDNLNMQNTLFPWIYAGKSYDKDLNLVDFGYRYYDPDTHRWISKDPLGTLQSGDLYEYCFNNPQTYIDVDGRIIFFTIALEAGGAAISWPIATAAGAIYVACEYGPGLYEDCKNFIASKNERNYSVQEIGSGLYTQEILGYETFHQLTTPIIDPTLPNKIDKRDVPKLPCDPKNTDYPKTEEKMKKNPEWKIDTKSKNGTTYVHGDINEYVRYDKGDKKRSGFAKKDHHHRYYVDKKGKEQYLDKNGDEVKKGNGAAHL
jgi:RHS repeat-associated protein